jgi:hypothetical protein
VEKGQTIQWPQYTKGISRICKWKKDRQFNGHKIPKAYLDSVSGKRTDNSMAKEKGSKGQ